MFAIVARQLFEKDIAGLCQCLLFQLDDVLEGQVARQ